jgi:hypothetical protein
MSDQWATRDPDRHQSERSADFDRNTWPTSIGMPGRHHRNPQCAYDRYLSDPVHVGVGWIGNTMQCPGTMRSA